MTSPAPRIVLLTGTHLCHNPRALKEASALAEAGFDVTILGGFFDEELKERDGKLLRGARFRYVPVIDMTFGGLRRFLPRATGKLSRFIHRQAGFENVWQLGYAYGALRRAAFSQSADLFITHNEQAMAVGVELLRQGRRVGVDMEDWFSEDLLPDARRDRPLRLLAHLERILLTAGSLGFCTSHALADALATFHQHPPPNVIYNTFPWRDRATLDGQFKDRRSLKRPSLHWFSQTIGPGRGLHDLFTALHLVQHDIEIHVRGKFVPGYQELLTSAMPADWADRVFFHESVHNDELFSRIAEHDIGFCGERVSCRSRDLTVSNKLFHYLLGGLAIVASDTAGQREIAAESGEAIRLYSEGDPISLAKQLNALLASREELQSAKAAALNVARAKYCWEIDQAHLVQAVMESLNRKPGIQTRSN
jgi:glycosyltransferase involved in cell wall biosynthesis